MSDDTKLPLEEKPLGDLIAYYLKARETKAELASKIKQIDDMTAQIQQAILVQLDAQGVDSTKVRGVGMVTRTVKKMYSCEDWSVFYNWLMDRAQKLQADGESPTQIFSFLQKRMSSTEIEDFKSRFDETPPAVNMSQEYSISVRKDS